MTTKKVTYTCDACGNSFQFGPGLYNGKRNQTYDIMVCLTCHNGNWDGWAPKFEAAVTRRLKEKGLPLPQRNAKGWLPRE